MATARAYRHANSGAELRIVRGDFHRHTEISPDGAGDGSLEDYFRYMIDAAPMDTGIVTDHNAGGDEYTWWRTEKAIDSFHVPGGFTPLFGYERSVPYPNGHRNVVFDQRGVKVLPISQAENQEHSQYRHCAGSLFETEPRHRQCSSSFLATDQGSDYRDNDPELEPMVEIYQGYHANYEYEGAPRAESAAITALTWSVSPRRILLERSCERLQAGYRSQFRPLSTHTPYTMIYTPTDSGATSWKYAEAPCLRCYRQYRSGCPGARSPGPEWMMGDAFVRCAPAIHVKVLGTAPLKRRNHQDGNFVYITQPNDNTSGFDFTDTRPPGESWYYVRSFRWTATWLGRVHLGEVRGPLMWRGTACLSAAIAFCIRLFSVHAQLPDRPRPTSKIRIPDDRTVPSH